MPHFRTGYPRLRLQRTGVMPGPPSPWPVEWQTVIYEQGTTAMWSPVTPSQVVIPRTGLWMLTAGINVGANILSTYSAINIRRNGTSLGGSRVPSGGQILQVVATTVSELVAGDVIDVASFTNGAAVNAGPQTNLTVTRIGPERWT